VYRKHNLVEFKAAEAFLEKPPLTSEYSVAIAVLPANFFSANKEEITSCDLESPITEMVEIFQNSLNGFDSGLNLDFTRTVLFEEFLHHWAYVRARDLVRCFDHLIRLPVLTCEAGEKLFSVELDALVTSPKIQYILPAMRLL